MLWEELIDDDMAESESDSAECEEQEASAGMQLCLDAPERRGVMAVSCGWGLMRVVEDLEGEAEEPDFQADGGELLGEEALHIDSIMRLTEEIRQVHSSMEEPRTPYSTVFLAVLMARQLP